ncbi:MAG: ABC transporter substrate-binding protein, partial [Ramlibacter sp.]
MQRRNFLAQGAKVAAAAAVASTGLAAGASTPIFIGQSAALTGPQAGFGTAIRDGVQAALLSANRNGGIGGRPVQLLSLDDQGDKAKTEANVAALVANRQV